MSSSQNREMKEAIEKLFVEQEQKVPMVRVEPGFNEVSGEPYIALMFPKETKQLNISEDMIEEFLVTVLAAASNLREVLRTMSEQAFKRLLEEGPDA
jgi:hypothetical protein